MQTNQTSVLVNGDIEMITADPKPFAAIASKIAELEPGADAAELTELLVDASIELAAQLKAA